MKKIKIIVLITALAFIFTSCISKADVEAKENEKAGLEDEYSQLEDEAGALKEEINEANEKLSGLSEANEQLLNDAKVLAGENAELMESIPQPPMGFVMSEFNDHLLTLTIDITVSKDSNFVFGDSAPKEKTTDELTYFTHLCFVGDSDDEYVKLTYACKEELDIVYEISVDYKSENCEDYYNTFVKKTLEALITITEEPYTVIDGISEKADKALEDGSYLDDLFAIAQTAGNNSGTTRIYSHN